MVTRDQDEALFRLMLNHSLRWQNFAMDKAMCYDQVKHKLLTR